MGISKFAFKEKKIKRAVYAKSLGDEINRSDENACTRSPFKLTEIVIASVYK